VVVMVVTVVGTAHWHAFVLVGSNGKLGRCIKASKSGN
jgi:hypothetical protein